MTSSPLFTRVAESTVIFLPMLQFGCFNASSKVTCSNSSRFFPRKGPPEAVSRIFAIRFCRSPFKDWKIALCSLSTGRIGTPHSFANGMIRCPAVTSVSLFASAIVFFALMASTVGRSPNIPTTAVTKISACGSVATSISPSMPETILMSISRSLCRKSAAFSSDCTDAKTG